MADKDVITAMELCANISQDGCMMLCPYKDDQDETYPGLCEHIMKQDALELLKRQQAEIDRLKSGQPKKGHWEERKRQKTYTGTPYVKYRCSVCGEWVDQYENSAFCPFCGADMRGEQDEKGNN